MNTDPHGEEVAPRKVGVNDARLAGSFADRLYALGADEPTEAYIVPGQIEIHHESGWLIAVAVYEDDQWWLDFSRYGEDTDLSGGSVSGVKPK